MRAMSRFLPFVAAYSKFPFGIIAGIDWGRAATNTLQREIAGTNKTHVNNGSKKAECG